MKNDSEQPRELAPVTWLALDNLIIVRDQMIESAQSCLEIESIHKLAYNRMVSILIEKN